MPLTLKPAPLGLTWTWEMVTDELPVFVSVTDCELLWPTATLLKLRLAGLAESARVAEKPEPLRGICAGEFGALLAMISEPVTLPVAAGAKLTVKVLILPGLMLKGRVTTLRPEPVPVAVAWEMVRVAVPVLERVTAWVLVVPTATFPKLTLVGAGESAACTPKPLRAKVIGEFDASDTTETVAEELPEDFGAKPSATVAACPGATVWGTVSETVKLELDTLTEVTVTLTDPLFVRVRFWVAVLPTLTLPKSKVVEFGVR